MKVICVDDTNQPFEPFVKEGCQYTVVNESGIDGCCCYQLAELTESGFQLWTKCERFIPTSTIDETTFERNYQTQKQPA